MDANTMAVEMLQIVDKMMSYNTYHIEDDEISVVLSQAQEEFVKTTYNPNGNKYGDGFENSEKRRKDLAQLVSSAVISYENDRWEITKKGTTTSITDANSFFRDSSIIKPNGSLWKLPGDFLWAINEQITWDTTDICWANKRINVVPKTYDEYNRLIDNELKNPWSKLVWRLDLEREFSSNDLAPIDNQTHQLVTHGPGIDKYYLDYIRVPVDIVVDFEFPANMVDCELNDSTHREILEIAARKLYTRLSDPRLQAQMVEEQKSE